MDWSQQQDSQDLMVEGLKEPLSLDEKMDEEQVRQDGHICQELYGCCPSWVPAYASAKELPFLTGGMAVQFMEPKTQSIFSWFQLKPAFKERDQWWIYSRQELISHEMCHICRFHLGSIRYEETLAYRTSRSGFRRKLGGALLTPKDNALFFLSLIAWTSVDVLSIFELTFTGLEFLRLFFPIFLILGLFRCIKIHRELRIAEQKIHVLFQHLELKTPPLKLLFCLSDGQIAEVLKMSDEELQSWWRDKQTFQFEFFKAVFN